MDNVLKRPLLTFRFVAGSIPPLLILFCLGVVQLAASGGPRILTINEAVNLALKNDKNYLISREEVNRSKHRLRQNLGFLPTITLQASKILNEKLMEIEVPPLYPGAKPQNAPFDFTRKYEVGLQIVQPLFTGGKIFYNYKNARLDLDIAREKRESVRQDVILQVKKTFFNILVLEKLREAHQQALKLAETNLGNIKANYDVGIASKYDLLRAQLTVSSIKPSIAEVEKLIGLAFLSLKFMTGIPAQTQIHLDGTLTHRKSPLQVARWIDSALSNRSEILQMEKQIRKSKNMQKIAHAQFLPDISLVAAYSYRSDYFNFRKGNWDGYNSVYLGIRFPIFARLERIGRVGETKVLGKILNLHYRQLKDTTRLQVSALALTLQQEYANIQAGEKEIETASEGVRVAEVTYLEGLISILELNSSIDALTRARVRYLQALYNYNIAAAELEKISRLKLLHNPQGAGGLR